MSGRTKTERVTRIIGQSVIIGDTIITLEGINGFSSKMARLSITTRAEEDVEVPMDVAYLRENTELVQNAAGWWESRPKDWRKRI